MKALTTASPFLDPLTDFGFKYLFSAEANKNILISFLNAVFGGDKKITGLNYGAANCIPKGYQKLCKQFCLSLNMETTLEKYKGIHPGMILERELKKRNIKKRPFALSLHEYPQILNEVTKGKRGLTPALSLKIDKALGLEEGTMLVLQAYYEIKREKQKNQSAKHPDLSIIRKILFWDTDIDKIDWEKQHKAVIQRIFERGNDDEKEEIIKFYGNSKVEEITGSAKITDNKLLLLPHHKLK